MLAAPSLLRNALKSSLPQAHPPEFPSASARMSCQVHGTMSVNLGTGRKSEIRWKTRCWKSWRQWTRPSLTEPKTKHLPLRLAAARSEAQIASKSSRNRKMPPIWTRQLMSARDWRRSWATSVPGQQNRRLGLNGWFSKGPVKGGENVFGFFPPPQFLAHRDLSYSWPPSAGCAFNLCLEESKTWVYCVCVIYLYIYIFIIYI